MVEWRTSEGLVPYEEALAFMEARVAAIAAGEADEMVWLLEHPPLYTAGTSARAEDLTDPGRFPVVVLCRLFVAAGQVHRFEDFSNDFAVWVFFYGPDGGEEPS